jgi:hypothetical protein
VDHLTPDVLAAWMDGTLSAAERSAAEAHASDCVHCQAMLAAMARTAPPVAARAWWSFTSIRWLVPVAAAALVIAMWVGVVRERHIPAPAAKQTASAALESTRAVSAPENAHLEPRASVDEVRAQPEAKSDAAKTPAPRSLKDATLHDRKKPEASTLDALQKKRADGLSTNAARAESQTGAAGPPAPQPSGGVAQSAPPASNAAAAAAPPPPTLPPVTPPQAAEPSAKPLPLQERVTVTSETPGVAGGRSARAAVAKLPSVEVTSPERRYRWRAVMPGSVQYSMDGGMNWRSSETGTSVALHAGSAPSRTVCWLVGQAGTVLLTTDGQNWQVRPFPERLDLTDVSATDARNATVTAADRRRFATSDGGATWSPLQEN